MKSLIKEYEDIVIECADAPEGTEIEIKLTDTIVIGLMLCERLDKIGELLEFSDNLVGIRESLHKLAKCASISPKGDQVCVANKVTSCES